MKILVKGSLPIESDYYEYRRQLHPTDNRTYAEYVAEFFGACEGLGQAIAEAGHTIMVGVPRWRTLHGHRHIAAHIIMGAEKSKSGKKTGVIFFAPQDPEPPDDTDIPDTLNEYHRHFTNVQIEQKFLLQGSESVAMIPDVLAADAVILIGGGNGTASIGYAAYFMKKPVLPISNFWGTSEIISDNLLFKEYSELVSHVGLMRSLQSGWLPVELSKDEKRLFLESTEKPEPESFTADDSAAVPPDNPELEEARRADNNDDKVDPDNPPIVDKVPDSAYESNALHGADIIHLVEEINHRFQLRNSRAVWVLRTILGYLFVAILAWVAIFALGFNFRLIAFYSMLFISASMGTGLRMLTLYQTGIIGNPSFMQMITELVIAFIVAFGMSLLYHIGSLSFTGSIVTPETLELSNFQSVAISMSLLGLASGYLVPLQQLEHGLHRIVSTDTD